MWFKRKTQRLEPEIVQLTDDLVALIWTTEGSDDRDRKVRWSIGRVNRNGGKPFRTLTPDCLPQIAELTRRMAQGLAQLPELSNDLRVKLEAMAQPPREAGELTHLFSPAALEALRARRNDGSEPSNGSPLRF